MELNPEFQVAARKRVPLIHNEEMAPRYFKFMQEIDVPDYSKDCPENLRFVTVHNYDEKSLFEKSLELFNLECTVIKSAGEWKYHDKVTLPLKHFEAEGDKHEIIVFCDASDVVLKRNPKRILDVFESYECDALFMTAAGAIGYGCMPDRQKWHESIYGERYLNSGVYVGRVSMLVEIWNAMIPYCGDEPIDKIEYHALGMGKPGDPRLKKRLPDYPYNALDQDMFRYIHRDFYPRMKLDIKANLAWRS